MKHLSELSKVKTALFILLPFIPIQLFAFAGAGDRANTIEVNINAVSAVVVLSTIVCPILLRKEIAKKLRYLRLRIVKLALKIRKNRWLRLGMTWFLPATTSIPIFYLFLWAVSFPVKKLSLEHDTIMIIAVCSLLVVMLCYCTIVWVPKLHYKFLAKRDAFVCWCVLGYYQLIGYVAYAFLILLPPIQWIFTHKEPSSFEEVVWEYTPDLSGIFYMAEIIIEFLFFAFIMFLPVFIWAIIKQVWRHYKTSDKSQLTIE